MKYLKMAFGLVVAASLMTVVVAPATAAVPRWVTCDKSTSEKTGRWENSTCTNPAKEGDWETKEVLGTMEVTTSGNIQLEDDEAGISIECRTIGKGWIADLLSASTPGAGGTTTMLVTNCLTKSTCDNATVLPRNLPWGSRLVERGNEVRSEITKGPHSETGNGEPGWTIECLIDGIKETDRCERQGNTANIIANRAEGTIETAFDERAKEETMASCTLRGASGGLVKGTLTTRPSNGNALWVLAPNLVTPPQPLKPRWVTCNEGKAKAGKWENSTCTNPAKEGDWETDEAEGTSLVTTSGKLDVEDNKAEQGIECEGTGTGWIADLFNASTPGEGGVATITATKCTTTKGACEKPNAKARNLPWDSRLEERGSEVRDEIVKGPRSETGNGEPGWSVECLVSGILKITDTCERQGNTINVIANRTEGTIEEIFDEITKEERMATCTVGGEKTGLVKGTITAKSTSGHATWVLAPNLKT
jgi:hypothetical protein